MYTVENAAVRDITTNVGKRCCLYYGLLTQHVITLLCYIDVSIIYYYD